MNQSFYKSKSGGMTMGGSGGATTCSKKIEGEKKRKLSRRGRVARDRKIIETNFDKKRFKSVRKNLFCNKLYVEDGPCHFVVPETHNDSIIARETRAFETKHRRLSCIDDVVELFLNLQHEQTDEPHSEQIKKDSLLYGSEEETFIKRFLDFIVNLRNTQLDKNYIKVFENMIYLCLILYKTDDSIIITSSTLLFIGSISDHTFVEMVTQFIQNLFNEKEPQAFCSLDFIRGFKLFKNSQMLVRLNSLLSLVISLGLLQPVYFTMCGFELFKNEGLKILQNSNDFFDYIVDLVEYFITEGQRFFETGLFDFRSQNELSQIDDTIIHLKSNIERIVNGDYEMSTGRTVSQYQNDLMTTLESCRYLANNTRDKSYRAMMYGKVDILTKITIIFDQCRPMAGMRQAPYAFSVYGLSSVGKSSLVNILTLSVLKYNGFGSKDSNICTLQSNDKFYSTYKADTTAVLLDDLANNKDERATISPSDMIISLVNNVPYYAPKAEASEKGKIIVQPKVVSVTTNVKDLSSNFWSNEPISVLRRLDLHITVKVKQQYATSGKLDSSKLTNEILEEYSKYGTMDVWLLTLEVIVPQPFKIIGGPEPYNFEVLSLEDGSDARDIDIYVAIKTILARSTRHYTRQATLVNNTLNMADKLNFCRICKNCKHRCECIKEPHSFIFEKTIDYVASKTANTIYDKLSGLWERIQPTYLEKMLASRQLDRSLPLMLNMIMDKYFNFFNYVPVNAREDKFYQDLYCIFNRREFYGSLQNFWGISCLTSSLILYRTKMSNKYVNWSCFGIPVFGSLLVNRYTYYRLSRRLRNLPTLSFGDNVNAKLSSYGFCFLKTGVSIASGILVCKTIRSFLRLLHVPQGNLNPHNEEVILERDQETNVWAKNSQSFNYSSTSDTYTSKQMCNKLSSNCLHMFYEDDFLRTNVSCLVLKSNIFMCPYHFFFKNSDIQGSMYTGTQILGNMLKGIFRVKFLRSDKSVATFSSDIYLDSIVRIANHDLCIFQVHSGGVFNDITSFLGNGPYKGPILGVYRNPKGTVVDFSGYTEPCETQYKVKKFCSFTKPVKIIGGNITYNISTERGMCTACIVTDTKKPTLYGFHIAGYTGHTTGSYIHASRFEIDKAINTLLDELGSLECHSAGSFESVRYGVDMGIKDIIDNRSPVNYIENESYIIRGSIGTSTSYYSDIQPTFISNDVSDLLNHENLWGKPQFGPQRWKPWYSYLSVAAPANINFNPSLLKRAKLDYMKPLRRQILLHPKMVYPLSDREVINGRPGERFIDAINFQSGIGFPLTGKKKEHLEGLEGNLRFANEEQIYGTYDLMIMKYLNGERYYPIFKSCLKDEATLLSKDKVRVFQAAEISLQLGWRKYGLPVLRFLSCFPLMSECAVGINPFNEEWDQLHNYVTFDGNSEDLIVAGDYSKWDIRLPPDLVSMAFQIIIDLAEASGNYNKNELAIMKGLATDTIYFVTHFNGTLIELMSGVPSGHNLTAHINSICNSLLLRMCYFENNGGNFRLHCHYITYGDDFMGGNINNNVKFDHLIYKDFLSRYEIVLTMPNKKDLPTKYMNIYGCDFLKRRSVYCTRSNKYYGALSIDSLFKSLHNRGKIKVSIRQHIISVIESFIHELSYHEQEIFDYYMFGLRELCIRHSIVLPQLHFGYDDMYTFRNRNIIGLSDTHFKKPPISEDGYPLTLEASEVIDQLNSVDAYMSDASATTGDECEPNGSIQSLTNIMNNKEDERISSVRVALESTRLPEPHSELFGNGPGWAGDQVTQTGTTTLTAVHEEHFHELEPISQDMLSLRQDESRALSNYLSRPVRIGTYSITGALEAFQKPLLDMLVLPHIREKIRGYAYLNARLHVRLSVTASPQSSGCVHVALHPWWQRDNGLQQRGNTPTTTPTLSTCQMSQLPSIFIDFGTEAGGEINMPIIAPCNGLNISNVENIGDCFGLHLRTLFLPQLATGQTTPPQFHVLVWLTEVSLTGTTLQSELPAPQSDEYCKDHKEVPTSNLVSFKDAAKMAAKEITGRATDIGMDMMMGAMGLSNPSDPSGSSPVVLRTTQNMASTNAYCNIDNLAADVKNETTLDLTNLGYAETDPMSLHNIYTRWAVLGLFSMPSGGTSIAGLPLRVIPVNPTGVDSVLLGAQVNHYPTPVAIASLGFSKWRGTLRYRFRVVGSAFVKGKIRISHDVNDLGALLPTYVDTLDASRLNTVIWDLGTSRSIIVDVPWTSNLPFKPVGLLRQGIVAPTGSSFVFPNVPGANGSLLVSPYTHISDGTHSTVGIVVEVCGKEGMAFGDMRPVLGNYTFAGINNGTSGIPEPQSNIIDILPEGLYWGEDELLHYVYLDANNIVYYQKWFNEKYRNEPQAYVYDKNLDSNILSGEQPNSTLTVNIAGFEDKKEDSDLMCDACLGERFHTLRQMIKRYTMNWTRLIPPTTGQHLLYTITNPDRPIMKGWQGNQSVNLEVGNRRVTYARDSFLSMFGVCFMGMRGSLRHKVEVSCPVVLTDMSIAVRRSVPAFSTGTIALNNSTENGSAAAILASPDARAGLVLANSRINNVLEYSTPFHCRSKFVWAQDRTPQFAKISDDGGFDYSGHTISVYFFGGPNRQFRVNKYVAAGDDFTFMFYLYAPTMVLDNPPAHPQA